MIYPRYVLQNRILLCIYMPMTLTFTVQSPVTASDHLRLQKVIDHIKKWCDQWLLPLNIHTCSHVSYTCRLSIDTAYHINNINIQKVDQIRDLGILYDSHLTFKDLSLSLSVFYAGQAAIKLPSAEASKRAQCTSP